MDQGAAHLDFHALVLDGVYEADAAVFHAAPSPTTTKVQLVVDRVRERVEALLRARGLLDDEGEVADDADDDDGQRMLLAASVAGREALELWAGAVPRWRPPARPSAPPRRRPSVALASTPSPSWTRRATTGSAIGRWRAAW